MFSRLSKFGSLRLMNRTRTQRLYLLRESTLSRFAWGVTALVGLSLVCMESTTAAGLTIGPPSEPDAQPAPPAHLDVYSQRFDMDELENPLRRQVLEQLKEDEEQAMTLYSTVVQAGRDTYYAECVHCHGDHLDGLGMFAVGIDPAPTNFRPPGALSQLRESYVFWRIATGGAGLPKQSAPWESTMPDYEEILTEEQIWQVITFMYDRVGQVPIIRDQEAARAMSELRDERQAQRASLEGMELYQFYCALCHGEEGAGDGVAARYLYPAPRDFTIGIFKYKTSPAEREQPADEDLFNTIKGGLPRTGMPPWGVLLTDDQIRSIIPVVKGFDFVGTWAPLDAPDEHFDDDGYYTGELLSVVERLSSKNQIPFTAASVAKGRIGFEVNCTPCHGDDGRGNPLPEKKLRDDWGARVWPRDLTKPWTWRVTNVEGSPEQTIRNIFTRLSVGILGTPMPEHESGVSEEDRWHIANYEYTLRNTTPIVSGSRVIEAVPVAGALPSSVNDPMWTEAPPATTLMMLPNVSKGTRLIKPLNDSMTVRALFNGAELAFLLEMDDRTMSMPGDPDAETMQDPDLTLHSDAFAIQYPKKGAFTTEPTVEKPLFRHGDAEHPATIWYWNAGSVEPSVPQYTRILDGAGVEHKLLARDDNSELKASGEWVNGRWRVMITRSRNGSNPDDVAFEESRFVPVSFANWDGSNGEVGSRHMLTSWYWLFLKPTSPASVADTGSQDEVMK